MKVQVREVGPVVVLDLAGAFALGGDIGTLKDKVNSLVFEGRRHLLLNLREVSSIDSSGLSELVGAHGTVTGAGGEIKLVNVASRHRDLLALTRLVTVFETFDTEAEALDSFGVKV
jgi:anti-sigma B factor antagonist